MRLATYILITIIGSTFFILPSAIANNYFALGGGGGGSAKVTSLSLETGIYSTKPEGTNYFLGLSIPFIDHGEQHLPSEIIDSPSPHTDITSLGKKSEGLETGLLGKAGIGFFRGKLFVSLLGGVTRANRVEIARSAVGDHYYAQSEDEKIYGVYGAGISSFHEFYSQGVTLNFHLDYDNRRGVTGSIGWSW